LWERLWKPTGLSWRRVCGLGVVGCFDGCWLVGAGHRSSWWVGLCLMASCCNASCLVAGLVQ
jgi:hypothetical protein